MILAQEAAGLEIPCSHAHLSNPPESARGGPGQATGEVEDEMGAISISSASAIQHAIPRPRASSSHPISIPQCNSQSVWSRRSSDKFRITAWKHQPADLIRTAPYDNNTYPCSHFTAVCSIPSSTVQTSCPDAALDLLGHQIHHHSITRHHPPANQMDSFDLSDLRTVGQQSMLFGSYPQPSSTIKRQQVSLSHKFNVSLSWP